MSSFAERVSVLLVLAGLSSPAGAGTLFVASPARPFENAAYAALSASGPDGGAPAVPARAAEEPVAARGGMSPKLKAMLLSAAVPGLGQYWYGDRTWSYVFFGTEAAVWGTYATFHLQGKGREDRYEEYLGTWAGVAEPEGHDDAYYTAAGRFQSYEEYRVFVIRFEEGDLYPEELQWEWPTEERRQRYLGLRSDADTSFHRRDFTLAAALVNRALAVIHAARSVSREQHSAFSLHVVPDPNGLVPMIGWRTQF